MGVGRKGGSEMGEIMSGGGMEEQYNEIGVRVDMKRREERGREEGYVERSEGGEKDERGDIDERGEKDDRGEKDERGEKDGREEKDGRGEKEVRGEKEGRG